MTESTYKSMMKFTIPQKISGIMDNRHGERLSSICPEKQYIDENIWSYLREIEESFLWKRRKPCWSTYTILDKSRDILVRVLLDEHECIYILQRYDWLSNFSVR